jgi:hypothetical protein
MATPTNLPAAQTTGNVLTAAYMNDLRGAFRILQVVQDTSTTVQSTTSATYVDTDLSLTITPQSTGSKILAVFAGVSFSNSTGTEGACNIVRSSTTIAEAIGLSYNSAGNAIGSPIIVVLDSPSTASAVTYKVQFKRVGGVGSFLVNPNSSFGSLTLLEVSA